MENRSFMQRTVIHVVDDDESFQRAITRLLQTDGFNVRNYANAGDFLLARFDDAPGCILLDLPLPGPGGLVLQEALAARPDSLPIIFLSAYGDVSASVRAMKAGAADFLTKPVDHHTLLLAIQNALAKDEKRRMYQEELRQWQACLQTLTAREHQVFDGVIAGKMNKEIASDLGAAERTVKAHRSQVMEKMRADSLAQLVHIADQLQFAAASASRPSN
jgi:FixJ family two-component response regulator